MLSNRSGALLSTFSRRSLTLVLAGALTLGSCGGADHVSLAKESAAVQADMVDILKGITDTDSAKAAVSDLEKLGERMGELAAKGEKLGEPDAETQKELLEEAVNMESMEAMMGEMMRLSTISGVMDIVQPAMEAMGEAAK